MQFIGRVMWILFLGVCSFNHSMAIELKGLRFLINLISGDFMETKSQNELDPQSSSYMVSKGHTEYNFLSFITYEDTKKCLLYENAAASDQGNDGKKTPIKVKCIPGQGNGTLQIINSLKEVVTMLAPHGNKTKRMDEGNCALVLFYTRTCQGSALVAPHFNAVSRQFPDIKIGAIDALRFHSLNTDFGIVGLPTVMLFHQGRPVIKFNMTTYTAIQFANFVTKHTGLSPLSNVYVTSDDFHGPLPNKVEIETDYCLYLAWTFIVVCACYYFTKSRFYIQIVEMIKRNWRESGAQHERRL
ncbi:thioredoxin domain-containing protein 15 isoform X1 [Bradysia coprophila]|uniref:thioredoxin domain-containing protein 15 isoform X1 n=1 Tax=Bradysia coprophila TaxID=38358 RepID=UPI00187DA117|nr:thioredoxin domain-containing protein 15 isoform X1 [Bradysia coprophila]